MLRIATRNSPLALVQVQEVITQLGTSAYEILPLSSFGDLNKDLSLLEEQKPDFFTDTLDTAVLEDRADIAIHSAKDLPFPLHDGLALVALTTALDATDSLVSPKGLKLSELPTKACVGTSSKTRMAEIAAVRSDLTFKSIRGTIEDRLAQVDRGDFDAIVVATCALKRLGLATRITEVLPYAAHPLQGMLAILAKADRPDLKALFSSLDTRVHYGMAWLVGGGCGTYEMLTIKADRVLAHADVIFYDDLLTQDLLDRYAASKVYVGKRKDKASTVQDSISEMMYREVLNGKKTVRLKGGDPLLFSRGGEELDYLRMRHCVVEVVPGISAFQTCAASAAIPLTQRNISASLGIVSAHYSTTTTIPHLGTDTCVYYMGATKLASVKEHLMGEGHAPVEPVIIVESGGLPEERHVSTTVGALDKCSIASPALIIAGNVGKHYQTMDRLLYTGLDPTACTVFAKIIHIPLIATHSLPCNVSDFSDCTTLLFTSKEAIRYFCSRYSCAGKKIVVIGSQTGTSLAEHGYTADYCAQEPTSQSCAELILSHPEWAVAYPCSNKSDNCISTLKNVVTVRAYATKLQCPTKIEMTSFSSVFFSSPSTVDSFINWQGSVASHLLVYAMGPATHARLLEHTVNPNRIIYASTYRHVSVGDDISLGAHDA